MKILLVEDDKEAAEYLVKGLKEQGHTVDHAEAGKDGLFLAMSEDYDAMILDRMVPEVDGLSILQAIRKSDNHTPVLMLTAMDKVEERVKGLTEGADDYLAKPYSFTELLARLDAITRRKTGEGAAVTTLNCGDLEMDLLSRGVTRSGQSIDLLAREFQLLEYFMKHPHQIVNRDRILSQIWEWGAEPMSNVVAAQVRLLRRKLAQYGCENWIETVYGLGYRFSPDD